MEIANARVLSYRAVQTAKRELEGDGRIVGRWNYFGGCFSNVSGWLHDSDFAVCTEKFRTSSGGEFGSAGARAQ
jgi:hypothetical protein